MNTQYTLEELMCFKVFNNLPTNLSCDIKSLIVEWAQTQQLEQLVFRALAEGILSESKAAKLLQISVMTLHKQRQMLAEVV